MTLVETLAALAVVALGTMIVTPALTIVTSPMRLGPLAADIAALLVQARSVAIATNGEAAAIVDPVGGIVSAGARRISMPPGVALDLIAAESCRAAGSGVAITFSPSGSSCGAVMQLAQGERRLKIRVDWYSGHVSIQKS
ncbi:hypothetical protein BJF93_12820 [Xaviernesmea oryzae]|uniref:Type II secretion system protein GspH n=1 Tax=Xaviernesmea oryzae TaxID=464029 RepID=A0A1Q9AR08_9HYPH|nr:GspH/FimT family pseudopilin [Xaviernesmea oryzae]OLP57745.1 hypothetical protein BJF93_12820 [Xaviernesmea oryzae]SEM06417.1 general secretion pathway protein H [Xaviernesmea oryzae]